MLNRLSINTLLKSIIAMLATIVVVVMALGAWDSWKLTYRDKPDLGGCRNVGAPIYGAA